jgi:hypothetical protein
MAMIAAGCIQILLIIIILAGHDSQVAVPLGNDDDDNAGKKAEQGPESGQMLNSGVSVVFVDEEIDNYQKGEHAVAEPDYQLKPVS